MIIFQAVKIVLYLFQLLFKCIGIVSVTIRIVLALELSVIITGFAMLDLCWKFF